MAGESTHPPFDPQDIDDDKTAVPPGHHAHLTAIRQNLDTSLGSVAYYAIFKYLPSGSGAGISSSSPGKTI